jgi:Tol biopolymer transport system component/tRNA A-37 threonylcarbamoyl transferase component Bud32
MIGQSIGPYQVSEMIGRGGMGEVFKGRDTKLGRDVALKILPSELAKDPDRLARFEREARVLASLQHQNIAAIYGLEDCEGQPVLAMELALGEDLSTRLLAGPLPFNEIEKIARQMAKGLEFAHEKGIVHRDLKPANVKVAGDGQVKILDFGLARAFVGDAAVEGKNSDSFQPTITQALTGAGTVLGTAAYMSPEQARGYEVDRRSDIWAFGVILYEMMTGHRLFEGETATDTLAAILHKEPDWDAVPEEAPGLLVQICQRCLVKDPQHRLRDIGEARVALEGSGTSVLGLSTDALKDIAIPEYQARGGKLPWIMAAALAVGLGAVGFLGFSGAIGPDPDPVHVVRSTINLPGALSLDLNPASPGPVKVSPDGRYLAFTATDSGGVTMLYVRALDDPQPRLLPGTGGAAYQFWSPDSRSLAFFTDGGNLERVDIAGGPVVTICKADNGKGGSWNEDGSILFAPNHVASIHRVSADGGTPEPVTDLKGETDVRSHRFPVWLPGGTHFIYVAVTRSGGGPSRVDSSLRLAAVDGSETRELMPCQSSAVYAGGHILTVHDNILMARPFSLSELDFTGPARPVVDEVLALPAAHLSVMSAVDAGVLAFASGEGGFGNSRLFTLDRDGSNPLPLGEPLMTIGNELSPDGKYVALSMPDQQAGTFDIWIMEIERDLLTRLTFETESEMAPLWSPDGKQVAFSSDAPGRSNVFIKPVSGASASERLFDSTNDCYATDWSPDGSMIAYTEIDSTSSISIGLYRFGPEGGARKFRETSFNQGWATFSPDGRWLSYMSNETGGWEVFVESVEPGGGRWRVSSQGGMYSGWSHAGDRLYYMSPSGDLLAAEISLSAEGVRFGRTITIAHGLEVSNSPSFSENLTDGSLLVLKTAPSRGNSTLSLITGWQGLLNYSQRN